MHLNLYLYFYNICRIEDEDTDEEIERVMREEKEREEKEKAEKERKEINKEHEKKKEKTPKKNEKRKTEVLIMDYFEYA